MEYKIEIVKLENLKPNEVNTRQHSDFDIQNLVKSISKYGFTNPIIANKEGIILCGNGRFEAAKRLNLKEVPVFYTDMSEEDAKAYAIMDNRSAELSSWNLNYLLPQLESLNLDGLLEFTGFSEKDLKDLNKQFEIEKNKDLEAEEDDFDESNVSENKYNVERGQIFQLGKHRIMCGDSTSKEDINTLMEGKKADMVFTDPPYGMKLDADYSKRDSSGESPGGIKRIKLKRHAHKQVIGDNEDFKDSLITAIFDNFGYCKEIFTWGSDYYAELLPDKNDGAWFVWDKRVGLEEVEFTLSEFELCWSKQKHARQIARVQWFGIMGLGKEDIKCRVHPTQKPVKLSEWFIKKFSKEEDLVIDIYLGGGSTLIACEQLNRVCYGAEIDPHYVSVIIERYIKLKGNSEVYRIEQDGSKTPISKLAKEEKKRFDIFDEVN